MVSMWNTVNHLVSYHEALCEDRRKGLFLSELPNSRWAWYDMLSRRSGHNDFCHDN